jgi:hypothetical protein
MCCYTGHVRVGYIFSLHLHQDSASLCSINAIKISVDRWHSRLCHPSQDIIRRVVSKNNLPCAIFDNSIQSVCDACACTKSHQLPCLVSSSRSSSPLEHSFSDVWGPAIESFGCKNTMSHLLMIIVNLLGPTCCIISLMFSHIFLNFSPSLINFLIRRSLLFTQIGVESMIHSIPFSTSLGSLIRSLVPIIVSKMTLPSESTTT